MSVAPTSPPLSHPTLLPSKKYTSRVAGACRAKKMLHQSTSFSPTPLLLITSAGPEEAARQGDSKKSRSKKPQNLSKKKKQKNIILLLNITLFD